MEHLIGKLVEKERSEFTDMILSMGGVTGSVKIIPCEYLTEQEMWLLIHPKVYNRILEVTVASKSEQGVTENVA